MSEPIIAEATGHAGGGIGPLGPRIEQGMNEAAAACNAEGVADDTSHERLVELIGEERLTALLGDDAETASGADYIRASKLAARARIKQDHRDEVAAHEAARAAEIAAAAAPQEEDAGE